MKGYNRPDSITTGSGEVQKMVKILKPTVVALVLVSVLGAAGSRSASAVVLAEVDNTGDTLERCFSEAVNQARAAAGLPGLEERSDLEQIADQHSSQMAVIGRPFHNGSLVEQAPPDWMAIGENVGRGGTCGELNQALLESPTHRANILDPEYDRFGVGVVLAGGDIFVTELFMDEVEKAPRGSTRIL